MKCPKCQSENPDDTLFCGKCGTRLPSSEEVEVTETIETPSEELTTGSIFAGRYQIIEELGKGGVGRVYKVLDQEVNAKIALKLIKPEISVDKKNIERFRNELKTARDISHKNICRMYDLNKEAGSYYITMEFVPGEDLKSMIRMSGRLAVGTTIGIAKQICDGLAEAHRLGVVHRDIKPSNIMIDKEGNVRIMDFGIARSLKAKGITGAGVMIGTPEYMSPEQVEGKETDQRSDIYSLGVILYEMVTGQVPFEGDTPFTIGVKHKSEVPTNPKELNSQISDGLNNVILKCLEKDREKRYQSADDLHSELVSIEKGIPESERVHPKKKPLTSREITVTLGIKKLFIPGLIVIGAIVIGLAIWQLLPEREVEKHSIAVISFENQTGNSSYDYLQKAIPNLLITNLEQSKYLSVTTWERLHDLLKQKGKEDVGFIDSDLGFGLCRQERIKALVLGSFVKAGDAFVTDVKVFDVETKNLIKSANKRGRGVQSILENQIDELTKEISRGVGLSERKIESEKTAITNVTTSSMEAYNYYLRGSDAFSKNHWNDAQIFFGKAVELDPKFADAYFQLGRIYEWLRDTRARNDAYKKAMLYSDRTTIKQKMLIETFYASDVERDPEKGIRILKQILKEYPQETRFHYRLGWIFQHKMNLTEEATEEYNKYLEVEPHPRPYVYNQLGYIYMGRGKFEKSLEYFKKYEALSPGDANPVDSLAELYFTTGRLDESITKYKEAIEIKPDFYEAYFSIGYINALKEDYVEALKWIDKSAEIAPTSRVKAEICLWRGFYHYWLGSYNQSLDYLRQIPDLVEETGNELMKALSFRITAWLHMNTGEFDQSRELHQKCLEIWEKIYPEQVRWYEAYYHFCRGFVDVTEGKIDSAESQLGEMKSLLSEVTEDIELLEYYYDSLHGEILLAKNQNEEVVSSNIKTQSIQIPGMLTWSLLKYNQLFLRDVVARAYKQKGDLDKAISEYEMLVTFDPESKERRLIHPKYHYRLAKLYEQKGWEGKAIEHYERFLDLWKNADPSIQHVEDARKRMNRLKTRNKLP
jgi:serine/threonine protein kinase/Tfp pilus assembly protein PilF